MIEKFRPIVKKSLNQYISEMMNDKIKNALTADERASEPASEPAPASTDSVEPVHTTKIVTTQEELEAYFIVKSIVKELFPLEDITYKDTGSYFAVLYKGSVRKWICRFMFTPNSKLLVVPLPDQGKKDQRFSLQSVYDIEQYKEQLLEVSRHFIE